MVRTLFANSRYVCVVFCFIDVVYIVDYDFMDFVEGSEVVGD